MITWIIYYGDGFSFTSDDGPPEAAPRINVQVVVNHSVKRGKLPWHSVDYYCWQEPEWVPHAFDGLLDYLAAPGKEKIVLRSYAIPAKAFMSIYEKAIKDPRIPWVSSPLIGEPLHQHAPTVD
jgi:hypothetical protein